MKKGNIVTYVLRLSLTLLAITAAVALVLAGVNSVTAARIQQLKEEKMNAAMAEVLPGAENLESVAFTDETGLVKTVYASDDGYVVEVAPVGFGGAITMMVGILPDGTVNGISIVSHTETAGLGSVAGADTSAGQSFRDQFVGQSGSLAVDKDGGTIDSITSATITSRAVTDGVNAALAAVAALG